jgi:hypothetical protein
MDETFEDKQGPIEQLTWGSFRINGKEHAQTGGQQVGAGKDIRIIGEEVTSWKEGHEHLLTIDMITGVFDQDIDVLIIGTGILGSVECPITVEEAIRRRGIDQVILERTADACRIYNELFRAGKKVAMLAHGTC